MRILVTGSAGRLGRSTVNVLVANGHAVIGVDQRRAALAGATEIIADVGDPSALTAAVRDTEPEAIIHLAAISVPFSAPETEILRVNTQLAHSVLEAARVHRVHRVLCASSPTLIGYGAPTWRPSYLPIDEEHPTAPTNAYALSKVLVEEMVRMYARSASGVYGAFRPCYVIPPEEWAGAPTQQGHTIVERLADPALAAVSLFNYVDARDAGEFVDRWLEAPGTAVNGETFFVGAADALAVSAVAELAPRYAPQLSDAAAALAPSAALFSNARATRLTGWVPRRTWRTELDRDLFPATDLPATPDRTRLELR